MTKLSEYADKYQTIKMKRENGIIEVKELLNIAKRLFGYSDTYAYSKINKGIDKFWRKPFGLTRQKKVCLIAIDKIILKYEILFRMFASYCIEIKQVIIHA